MKPIRNQILVKPFPSDEITEGGLIIPDSVKKINNKMRVVEVGKGKKDKPMPYKKDDVVYRTFEWGTEVVIDGELHFLMDADAILAKEN